MGTFENKSEELLGSAKEGLGKLTDNDKLEAEGKADQASANIKQAAENVVEGVKDAVDNVKDKLTD